MMSDSEHTGEPLVDLRPVDILCTLSGGYDSAACLLKALELGPTRAFFVDYRQPYGAQEEAALQYLVDECVAIIEHKNWRGLYVAHCPMGMMGAGDRWIPYRNLIIAALATNWATAWGCHTIVFGSKSEEYRPHDPVSFIDSTKDFYRNLNELVMKTTEPQRRAGMVSFHLPLIGWDKATVLQLLHKHGVALRRLWNCYREDGEMAPCGGCEHCQATQPLIERVLWNARDDRRDHDRHPLRVV